MSGKTTYDATVLTFDFTSVGTKVSLEDLEIGDREEKRPMGLKEAREALERKMVLDALARNQDSISQTAEDLGVSRPTLYDLMNKLGIKR